MDQGILTGPAIRQAVKDGLIEIDPYKEEHVNPASVDLRLGNGVAIYNGDDHSSRSHYHPAFAEDLLLDTKKQQHTTHWRIDEQDGLILEPGVLYLMHTLERVHTQCFVPVLDGKSSVGRMGIVIHLTAGYGDPGFNGQYTLEVTSVYRTIVYPGMRFCQIRFHTIAGEVEDYGKKGHYVGKSAEGPVPSMLYKQFIEEE